MIKSFIANKASLCGLILFCTIFASVFILSAIYPLDVTYQDITQQDVPPGFRMAKVPESMKENLCTIDIGPTFSVGSDKDGNLQVWGELTDRQKQIPEEARDIVQVSAGFDHLLALDSKGKVYTWGNNRFGLDKIPDEVIDAQPIKRVVAGHQFSLALSETGQLFFWGNENLIEMNTDSIPAELQHKISDVKVNSSNVVLLLEDGSLCVLGRKSAPVTLYPEIKEGFEQVAVSDQAAIGLTKSGQVIAWGNDFYDLLTVPREIQGNTVSISSGRFHFMALLRDGSVVAWGRNQFGQIQIPEAFHKDTRIKDIYSGYFLNYAIDTNGTVHSFGLRGYLMGTDGYGRDIFQRLVYGGRLTLTVGAVSVLISITLGMLIGGCAGFYGRKVDLLLMRFAEIIESIPFLPLVMTLSVLIGSRIPESYRIIMIMVILGLLSWPGMARLVRGQILAEREKDFVLAAKASGIREFSIIFRYILPNIMTPVITSATLSYASSMLTESALSFLGFGVAEPSPTWGNMLMGAQSSQVLANCWWRWFFPAISICLTTISINLIGDGLRDATDPRNQER